MPRLKQTQILQPLWYPPKQTAQLLNKSISQIYAEMAEGKLPYIQDGHNRFVTAETIRRRTAPAA